MLERALRLTQFIPSEPPSLLQLPGTRNRYVYWNTVMGREWAVPCLYKKIQQINELRDTRVLLRQKPTLQMVIHIPNFMKLTSDSGIVVSL